MWVWHPTTIHLFYYAPLGLQYFRIHRIQGRCPWLLYITPLGHHFTNIVYQLRIPNSKFLSHIAILISRNAYPTSGTPHPTSLIMYHATSFKQSPNPLICYSQSILKKFLSFFLVFAPCFTLILRVFFQP
jgi:hypothetical protein